MKTLASILGAFVLATGVAQASGLNMGNADYDMPSAPVTAQNPIQVKAGNVLSDKELARSGLSADAQVTVSDFTAPGPRSTFTR